MTAEIAILNKAAVALAADSAVTVDSGHNQSKVYNSTNKLFALSKHAPVGVMIFGSAEFLDVPWETIIKSYRFKLGPKTFGQISEYAADFVEYLSKNEKLFTEKQQENAFGRKTVAFFMDILEALDSDVRTQQGRKGTITEHEIARIVSKHIRLAHLSLAKMDDLASVSHVSKAILMKKYGELIAKARDSVFQRLPVSPSAERQISSIAANLFLKSYFGFDSSGVVVIGFGEDEYYPAMSRIRVDAVFEEHLRHSIDHQAVSIDLPAIIHPFAQHEMVFTFMEGVNDEYQRFVEEQVAEMLVDYNKLIAKHLPGKLSRSRRESVQQELNKAVPATIGHLKNELHHYRRCYHIDPVLDAVEVLPAPELAVMAESLVHLTSLKRRMSLDAETVGGPIDVAVISKGDGFVWIKRKHYFVAELNHQFFATYYTAGNAVNHEECQDGQREA